MRIKKIILIAGSVLLLVSVVLVCCLIVNTAPDTLPEPTVTAGTEPDHTEATVSEPLIPHIEDDRSGAETIAVTEIAEMIADVAEYDNGHNDMPTVIGEVYIVPGYKEVDQ